MLNAPILQETFCRLVDENVRGKWGSRLEESVQVVCRRNVWACSLGPSFRYGEEWQVLVNRAVAETLWTEQWRNICGKSSGGIFVERRVKFVIIHADKLLDEKSQYQLVWLQSSFSKCVGFCELCFVQRLKESGVLKNFEFYSLHFSVIRKLKQRYKNVT